MDSNGNHGWLYAITIGVVIAIVGKTIHWFGKQFVVSWQDAHIAIETEKDKANQVFRETVMKDIDTLSNSIKRLEDGVVELAKDIEGMKVAKRPTPYDEPYWR